MRHSLSRIRELVVIAHRQAGLFRLHVLGFSFRQKLLGREDPVGERADVCVSDDDLGRELYVKRLLDGERDALRLPLRPEPEIVRVAAVLRLCRVAFAGLRDERGVGVVAERDDVQ